MLWWYINWMICYYRRFNATRYTPFISRAPILERGERAAFFFVVVALIHIFSLSPNLYEFYFAFITNKGNNIIDVLHVKINRNTIRCHAHIQTHTHTQTVQNGSTIPKCAWSIATRFVLFLVFILATHTTENIYIVQNTHTYSYVHTKSHSAFSFFFFWLMDYILNN